MHEKEQRVKDQRLRDATRKSLLGLDGKFGIILKQLGHPIITQGGSLFESNELPDFYAEIEDDHEELPIFDEDQIIMEIGYIFDGLSSGLHLEVKYLAEKQELSVYYQGNLVYCEISNELTCYVPSQEWEGKIDMLYNRAKIKENKNRKTITEDNQKEAMRNKLSLLERLRIRWGLQ